MGQLVASKKTNKGVHGPRGSGGRTLPMRATRLLGSLASTVSNILSASSGLAVDKLNTAAGGAGGNRGRARDGEERRGELGSAG